MKQAVLAYFNENMDSNVRDTGRESKVTAKSGIVRKHPSDETGAPIYRPSIKVGYQVVSRCEQPLKSKRKIDVNTSAQLSSRGKKRANASNLVSGRFVSCEYVGPTPEIQLGFSKKGVKEARKIYQNGQQVKKEMQNQFTNRTLQEKSCLGGRLSLSRCSQQIFGRPSSSMKEVLAYQYAGDYRPTKLAIKCSAEAVKMRSKGFRELHQVDFRRRLR